MTVFSLFLKVPLNSQIAKDRLMLLLLFSLQGTVI